MAAVAGVPLRTEVAHVDRPGADEPGTACPPTHRRTRFWKPAESKSARAVAHSGRTADPPPGQRHAFGDGQRLGRAGVDLSGAVDFWAGAARATASAVIPSCDAAVRVTSIANARNPSGKREIGTRSPQAAQVSALPPLPSGSPLPRASPRRRGSAPSRTNPLREIRSRRRTRLSIERPTESPVGPAAPMICRRAHAG